MRAEGNGTAATLGERLRTQTELEMEAGRKAVERRTALRNAPVAPETNDAPVCPSPHSSGKTTDPGIAAAAMARPASAQEGEMQPAEQPRPDADQANRRRANGLKFDRTTAVEFYKAVRPSACILGFKLGRRTTSVENFQALATDADDRHEHFFFHVATVKPTWTSSTSATKGQILECNFLWGDCDAKKYTGKDLAEAATHYADEGFRISQAIDGGLSRLGITPYAKWRSGAGWQFLIRLDQPISPDEAEVLVGKLHVALGFDPVVRNCNRIFRVPGSINWKNGKDGRVPSQCLPMCLRDTVTSIDHVRNALANVAMPERGAKAIDAGESKIDWAKVRQPGWLKSVGDLPSDFPIKLRRIMEHTGNLDDLNYDLMGGGYLSAPYRSWSEVILAIAAGLKSCGKYTSEEIAEALLADLPCNQHIAKQKDKERAIERAITRSHGPKALAIAGVIFRDNDRYGKPKASLANAVISIRALGIDIQQDLFHRRIEVIHNDDSNAIQDGLLTDDTVSAIRSMTNNTYQVDCGDNNTLAAIKEVARDNAYDPVLDMLADFQSKWDGAKRLDTWVIDYLGCEDTPLNRAIGRLVLIAGCHRAREPGCKFDSITVLEGVEGTNKSTVIRILAGDENFSDQAILGANDKEVQEQLDGIWMHENADLAGMRKADVEQVKAFASRQVDRARPAYGRVREDRPRRSIEWGTTNNKEYLQSQTGNRRFWPLETGKIDKEALIRDREQLLGEAAAYEAAGETIELDEKLWGDARDAQEQRRVADPWEDILINMPDEVVQKSGDGYERVASTDVLSSVLNIPEAQQTSAHGRRLADAIRRVGWDRTPSGRVTINGAQVRGYVRREQPPSTTSLSGLVPTAPPGASLVGANDTGMVDELDAALDAATLGVEGSKTSP